MKAYKIPVSWEEYGVITILADTLDEAIDKVCDPDIPLPKDSSYIEGSFRVEDSVYDYNDDFDY